MKKIKLLLAIAVCSCKLNSQPFYGEVLHKQGQTTSLTTGTQVTLPANAGFIIGGNVATSTPGIPNFIINKLSQDGTLTGAGNPFSMYYTIAGDAACSASPLQANNCAGICVKEYNSTTSTMAYAVAGAFDDGVFFVSLDNTGNVINRSFYTFPATSSQASKPILVISNGLICIVGSFVTTSLSSRQLYILKVSQTGSFLQSKTYNMAALCNTPGQCPCGPFGFDVTPNDAILSPFASSYPGVTGEIIIVGDAKKYGNWAWPACLPLNESSGFFLRLGANNLLALSSYFYDYGTGINGFTSIAPATNIPGSESYIIGGYSDLKPAFGQAWMLKVDHQNASPIWSRLLSSTYGNLASIVSGVGYRSSSLYGDTYYGVLSKGNGGLVAKLDGVGSPFFSTFSIDNKNEFNYLVGSGATINSSKISLDVTPSVPNEGIHVYGTGNNNQYFLGLATFNGESNFTSGCSTSSSFNGLQIKVGPLNAQSFAFNLTPPGMLVYCPNFNVTASGFSPASTTPCQLSGSLPTNGSNNKGAIMTGLNKQVAEAESSFKFLPNPTSGKLSINFTGNNTNIHIALYDCMGKKVLTVFSSDKAVSGEQSIDVDLSGLPEGIYFAKVNANNKVTSHKIVYTKN